MRSAVVAAAGRPLGHAPPYSDRVATLELQAGASLLVPMSYDEYEGLGETPHTEYVDGCAVMNPPTLRHVKVARRLTRLLEDTAPEGYDVLPEAGWRVGDDVLVPDVVVAPVDAPGPDLLHVAPLLVVEVTSPSTRARDWGRKRHAYAAGGAPWYWIADADAGEIAVLRHDGHDLVETARLRDVAQVAEPFPALLDVPRLLA